jgi:hypothetical protein
MNVTFQCPSCEQAVRSDVASDAAELSCPSCQRQMPLPQDAVSGGKLRRCLVCPSSDLFVRKDFPQRLGVAIVTVGFLLSCVAWHYQYLILTFGILFATAGIDVVLYAIVGESLVCYRCGAEYRLLDGGIEGHGAFNLETHERYRQQKAREPKGASASPSAVASPSAPPSS